MIEDALRCKMALTLCQAIREYRLIADPEFVAQSCKYVSFLCKENCPTAASNCYDAFYLLHKGNEEEYLKSCDMACGECEASKQYKRQQEELQKRIHEELQKGNNKREKYTV